MAQQTINIGASPNDGTGTPLRTAFQYTNSNFSELYTAVGPSGNNIVVPGSATITGDLAVRTNKLYVTATGVGCGMTPITPLSVSGAGGIIVFKTTDPSAPVASPYLIAPVSTGFSSTSPVYGYWYQSSGIGNPAVDAVSVITASNERYRIAADGVATWSNVGGVAGTAMTLNATGLGVGVSPSYKLDASATNNLLRLTSANGNDCNIVLTQSGVGNWMLYNAATNGQLRFQFGGNDRMIVDSSGNVGIGVTPSAWGTYKGLQVGYASLAGYAGSDTFLGSNVYFDGGAFRYISTATASNYRQLSGVHQWNIAPSGTAGNNITFTQAMTLDASGRLLVGPTSANASGGVLQLSSGITFPATQVASSDANTLDDYEEGNWTPSITFGGASVGMTGTFAGRYTKVGRAVTINGIIALTAKGSSTGIARIAGLPFTSANASAEYTAISIRIDRVSFADYPCGYVGPNSSVVEFENTTNAGTVSSMTDSNFINTSVVIVNFTYTV